MTEDTRTQQTAQSTNRVSRRRFVQAVGASGALTGLAGVGRAEGVLGSLQQQITLQWAASEEEAQASDQIVQALKNAGMSDNIGINFLSGGNVTDDRRNQYQQWLSAGREQPDLLRMDTGWTLPFIARNQLLNLSQNLSQETVDRVNNDYFAPAANSAKAPNGDLFAVPLWVGLPTMLYRKDLVTDAGHDPEGENWATESMPWQQFSQVTRDVLDQNSDIEHGFTFQADVYEGLACCTFNEFMTGWGGAYFGGRENLFGPVGERPVTVAEQPVIDSIRMVRTFINGQEDPVSLDGYAGNIVPEAVLQWTEGTSERPFANDNAIMHRNWPYAVNLYGSDENLGEDLGVMPIPYGVTQDEAQYEGTGGPTGALGGWHLAVNPNTQNQEAALEAVEAAATDQFNLDILGILGQIPPKPALLDTDEATNTEVIGRYMDTFKVVGQNAIPRPVTVVWPTESTQISQAVNNTYAGNQAPQPAMNELEQALTQIENSV